MTIYRVTYGKGGSHFTAIGCGDDPAKGRETADMIVREGVAPIAAVQAFSRISEGWKTIYRAD